MIPFWPNKLFIYIYFVPNKIHIQFSRYKVFFHKHQIPQDHNYRQQFPFCLLNDIFYLYLLLSKRNNDKNMHDMQEITEK